MIERKTVNNKLETRVVKAVLFDLDGTFADTAPDLAAALNHVRAAHKLPPLPLEMLRLQASHGSAGMLKLGLNVTPDMSEFAAMQASFLAHYTSHIADNTELFNGIKELISNLETYQIPWGIVTNKPHRFTLPLMQALGYAERAACLISGDTCAHAKPHPEPMFKACDQMGVAAENCLYLGDDLRDMQAARAANMRGIIARYGYISPTADLASWQAHAMINHPMELLAHLPL